MKKPGALLPEHEGLRRAIAWLAEERRHDAAAIEEASKRFNLSPLEEQFLMDHQREAGSGKPE